MTFAFPEALGQGLTIAEREHYRLVRATHTDDPATRQCRLCREHRCADYVWATRTLILSGEGLTERVTRVPGPRLPPQDH